MLVDTGLTGLSKKKEQGPKAVAIEGGRIVGVETFGHWGGLPEGMNYMP
jgi:hypothetical protein